MPKLLKSLIGERNPSHVTNHLHGLTKNWKGTFIGGTLCRILAKGYVSQRNTASTRRIYHLHVPFKGMQTHERWLQENVPQIHQLWTINHLAKTDLFLSKNVHNLEI